MKKVLLGAAVIASMTGASLKAAEKPEVAKKPEGIEMKLQLPSSPFQVFADKNGNFDAMAVEKAFDALEYQKKAPKVVEIYKDAMKNGFSEKHRDQLCALFSNDKNVSEALKNLDSKKAKKMLSMMSEPMNYLTGAAIGLIVILGPILIAYGSSSFDNDNKRSKFVRSTSLALVGSLVLLVGASHLAKGLYIEQMLKSEKKMKRVVIQAHRKAYETAVEDLNDQARKAVPLKLNELITNKYQNQSK